MSLPETPSTSTDGHVSHVTGERLKVGVVLSSTREGRLGARVGAWVRAAIERQHDVTVFGKLFTSVHVL